MQAAPGNRRRFLLALTHRRDPFLTNQQNTFSWL
jgi:hypothetical protein